MPLLGATRQHDLRARRAPRGTPRAQVTSGGVFHWPSCPCNFGAGDSSLGDITSLASSPHTHHSCGVTRSQEGSVTAKRPAEDVQLHPRCDECGWIEDLEMQVTLDEWKQLQVGVLS